MLDAKNMNVKLWIDIMFPEVYSEPSERSNMEIYDKVVNRL